MKEEMNKNVEHFYEEDEIDLWNVIKPLVKYKLQLLIVFIVGFIILAFWGLWRTVEVEVEPVFSKLIIEEVAIAPSVPIFKVTGVELIETITKDKKRVSYIPGDESLLRNYKNVRSKTQELFVHIQRTTTDELQEDLKKLLETVNSLDRKIIDDKFEKSIFQIKTKLEYPGDTLDASIVVKLEKKIKRNQLKKRNVIRDITNVIGHISQPIWSKVVGDKISWPMYQIVSQSTPVNRIDIELVNKYINKLSTVFGNNEKVVERLESYLEKNNVSYELGNLYLPTDKSMVKKKGKSGIGVKKLLILGLIGIFILAILSVYIRTWVQFILKSDKDSERWKDVIGALKYWKL